MENEITSADKCICIVYVYKMMSSELTITGHELSVKTLSQCTIAVTKANKALEINRKTIENKRKNFIIPSVKIPCSLIV